MKIEETKTVVVVMTAAEIRQALDRLSLTELRALESAPPKQKVEFFISKGGSRDEPELTGAQITRIENKDLKLLP